MSEQEIPVPTIADRMGVSENEVYNLLNSGALKGCTERDIENWHQRIQEANRRKWRAIDARRQQGVW